MRKLKLLMLYLGIFMVIFSIGVLINGCGPTSTQNYVTSGYLNGKTIKSADNTNSRNLILYFTDGSQVTIRSREYPIQIKY